MNVLNLLFTGIILSILPVQDGELQQLQEQKVLHSNLLLNLVLLSHDIFTIGQPDSLNLQSHTAQWWLLILLLRFLHNYL